MRPTWSGLAFRTFRMLFLITMIVGFFSACLSGLEGLQAPGPGRPGLAPAPGTAAPPR